MLSQTAKNRITKLIEFMEKLPKKADKHFNMGAYVWHQGDDHEHDIPKKPEDLLSCGTTACAMGWMATMPYFRRKGLSFVSDEGEPWPQLNGVHMDYYQIGRELLKLGDSQSEALFAASNEDATPKEWARRARKLLQTWAA